MPEDLYCTHVILYAVSPLLVHEVHIQRTTLDNLPQVDWCQLNVIRGSQSIEADQWLNAHQWGDSDEAGRLVNMLSLLQLSDFKQLCPESCQKLRDGKWVRMLVASGGRPKVAQERRCSR